MLRRRKELTDVLIQLVGFEVILLIVGLFFRWVPAGKHIAGETHDFRLQRYAFFMKSANLSAFFQCFFPMDSGVVFPLSFTRVYPSFSAEELG
jgi:hypothetical protein